MEIKLTYAQVIALGRALGHEMARRMEVDAPRDLGELMARLQAAWVSYYEAPYAERYPAPVQPISLGLQHAWVVSYRLGSWVRAEAYAWTLDKWELVLVPGTKKEDVEEYYHITLPDGPIPGPRELIDTLAESPITSAPAYRRMADLLDAWN